MQPATPEAFQLLMEGSQALADVEAYGMRIDVEYLDRTIEETKQEIQRLKEELREDEVWEIWERRFKRKADFGKREQLAAVFYEDLGYEVRERSEKTGKAKTDVNAMYHIDHPFLESWTWIQKLEKCLSTYLIGIRRETVDGVLHPFFNLHRVHTYRSSSSEPNFQNQPIRDARQAKLIRRAFIPREGEFLVEIDYSAAEWRGAASFWEDPNLMEAASNPELDVHRDYAKECYKLGDAEWTKMSRSIAKNQFVFPILYGSTWKAISQNLWEFIDRYRMTTQDEVPLKDHLRSNGVRDKDAFIQHIKQVDGRFRDQFSHWNREKDEWYQKYVERGWFPIPSGFACRGLYDYTNLMNTPIQGGCFHWLLWSLIQINRMLKEKKMGARICGQVHDSLIISCPRRELFDMIRICHDVMTNKVRDHWDWIKVPLAIEVEYSSKNWYEKRELDLEGVL